MSKLNEKAMIVYLSISQWTAKKIDAKATKELCDTHNTTSRWTRGAKSLIAEDEIQKINKIANKIRTFHNTNTLTWDRMGGGLLPNTNYLEYTSQMNSLKNEFDTAVSNFVSAYPTLQAEAAQHLNGLFNPADYPDPSMIACKFNVQTNFLPVPDSQDFRVSLQDGEADKIRQNIQEHTAEALTGAVRDLWERLHTTISAARGKLSDKDAIFRDSLIDNIKDVCKIIPRLNVTDDPNIEAMGKEAMARLTIDPEILRSNDTVRTQTADAASEILNKMKAYL